MTRTQTIARNIRLRVAMLLAHAPTWDVVEAQRAAGLDPAQWSRYQGGRERYCSDAMLERIAKGLWVEDGQQLLLSPTAVVALPIANA